MADARPEFYFSAEGDLGGVATNPKKAPDAVYSYEVYLKELMVYDDMETATGWKVNSIDLTDGEWERADPEATDAQPEDDHTENGTLCYVTDASGPITNQSEGHFFHMRGKILFDCRPAYIFIVSAA